VFRPPSSRWPSVSSAPSSRRRATFNVVGLATHSTSRSRSSGALPAMRSPGAPPLLAMLLLGLGMQQAGWIGHDYSHGRGNASWWISHAMAGLVNAFSYNWWSNKHNTPPRSSQSARRRRRYRQRSHSSLARSRDRRLRRLVPPLPAHLLPLRLRLPLRLLAHPVVSARLQEPRLGRARSDARQLRPARLPAALRLDRLDSPRRLLRRRGRHCVAPERGL
jgi:hypothetical protein